MPIMSSLETTFCRSAPWRLFAQRIIPWTTQRCSLTGDVLEIGGGSGAMAEKIVRTNDKVRLTTTDPDPGMVDAAHQRLARFPQAQTCQADATQLPFDDGSFDAAVSFLMLHHVVDWEQAVAEVARVLRPGGTFVGYDLTASRTASWLHVVDRSQHRFIEPGAFEPVLEQANLGALSLRYSFGGRVLRFVAQKPYKSEDDGGKNGQSV